MDQSGTSNLVELQKKAEELYPLPLNPCRFVKAKISWLRERWISQNVSLEIDKPFPLNLNQDRNNIPM